MPSARTSLRAAAALLFAFASLAHAQDTCTPPPDQVVADPSSAQAAVVPANKRTKANLYLDAKDAGPLVAEHAKEVLFLDVRTRGELMFIGMPVAVDAHIPFWLDPGPGSFDAAKGLTRKDPVVLLCQGGARAARAADVLAEAGFAQPWIVVDGFEGDPAPDGPGKGLRTVNGWRNAGLAWTTRLDPAKMYDGAQ